MSDSGQPVLLSGGDRRLVHRRFGPLSRRIAPADGAVGCELVSRGSNTVSPSPLKQAGIGSGLKRTGPGGAGRYVPVGDNPSPDRIRPPVNFDDWWTRPYQIDPDHFTRRDIVLHVANKEGGAHVDRKLDQLYADLTRTNFAGWKYSVNDGVEADFDGNVALANLRQIAHEVHRSIREQLPHALDVGVTLHGPVNPIGHGTGRNAPCLCRSGMKFKKCHGRP